MASILPTDTSIAPNVTQALPILNPPRGIIRNPLSSLGPSEEQPRNETLVSMQELIPAQVGSGLDVEAGVILKLLDIASCLSAEKHAKHPCVTVTLDDLIFENRICPGDIVHFTAKVSRAFTTSMEVGTSVEVEEVSSGKRQRVCRAYFTYVTQSQSGGKMPLPPVYPSNPTELKEFLLASERRRGRLTRKVSIQEKKQVVTPQNPHPSSASSPPSYAETVRLVLPTHANHHGTTFGGQLMEWMTSTAMIATLRFCHKTPLLLAVDSIHFREASRVGDRIHLKSSVNNVFNKSMEVGVRVTAYRVEGDERHISSAIFYLGVRGEGGKLVHLPRLTPVTEEEKRRAAEAYGRYHLRLDRRTFVNEKKIPVLDPTNRDQFLPLIYTNISSLMKLYTITGWQKASTKQSSSCSLFQYEDSQMFAFKCEGDIVGAGPEVGFKLLQRALLQDRKLWDKLCVSTEVLKGLTNDDNICRLIMKPLDHRERIRDFIVVVSLRSPILPSLLDPYAVAFSSVDIEACPPDPAYDRGQVISSGYVCSEVEGDPDRFRISYLHQISSTVLPFVAADLMGLSSVVEIVFSGMQKFISDLIARTHTEEK